MIKEIWWWDSNSRPLDHESPRLRQVFEHFNIFSFDNNDGFKKVFIYNCHNMNGDAISYLPASHRNHQLHHHGQDLK